VLVDASDSVAMNRARDGERLCVDAERARELAA